MALFRISTARKAFRLSMTMFVMHCLLHCVPAHGQSGYIIKHYTNENGLPANGIKGIELDRSTGFLWVGTQAGLVRFDGVDFEKAAREKTGAVSRTTLVAKNREGTIYWENDNFSVYRINGNQAEWVMADTVFYPFYQSKVWQSSYNSLRDLVKKLKTHQRSDFLPPTILFHDESGNDTSFSFVRFDHAYHYDAAADTLFDYPGFNQVLKFGKDVYFADPEAGLWRYNDVLKRLVAVRVLQMPDWKRKKSELPKYIWQPGMKAPLFLWQQDIWKLQGSGDSLELIPLCRECCPRDVSINSAQEWEERRMLILGSPVNGLYVIRSPFLRSFPTDVISGTGSAEYAQAETGDGVITTAPGLSFTDEGRQLPGISHPRFNKLSIYRDGNGDHWTHSGDTVVHFHDKQMQVTRIPLKDGSEKMIFSEMGDRLFVFSDRAFGEITGDQHKILYKLPYREGDQKNWLNPDAAVEWKPGVFAIATEKLLLFDIAGRTAPDTVPIPGLSTKVRALFKYGDYLMIGTYGQGFYLYRNGVIKKMPLDKKQYLSYVHCFVPDEKGFCWISTNHGLFKVSINALVSAYEKDLNEIYYHYFGSEDGIANTEFNGGCQPCALRLNNGRFSFPSVSGLVVIDPREEHSPPPSGKLFIDEITVDSTALRPGDSMLQRLPYSLRHLRFRLSLPQFGNSENIYFSYKLSPYNEQWESQDLLQNNILQFGALKPGRYILYLRVRNGYGVGDFATSSVMFQVQAPWYQSWWFYMLCVLCLIAVLWALVKWRTARINNRRKALQQQVEQQTKNIAAQSRQLSSQLRQLQSQQVMLEEDNKIKTRLIGIISHDMMSPLKFMGYLGTKLRDSFSDAEPAHKTASSFVKVTQELESLTVNMLDWIKLHHSSSEMLPELFNVHELAAESIQIASTLAGEKGLAFYNDVPAQAKFFQYRQAIGVIVYNLAMNAMKYTSAGEIRVTCQCTDKLLSLTVSDTGSGMRPELTAMLNSEEEFIPTPHEGEAKRYQFGFIIIKDLLRLVNGKLRVESMAPGGTRITVTCFLAD